MRISHTLIPVIRAAVVAAFVALCLAIFSFLWTNAGGKIPLITSAGYQVDVEIPDVDNLVFQSDVQMAGVEIGKIENVQIEGQMARVTLEINPEIAPLHEGATLRVRNKTLIEETYLEVIDGDGATIQSGTTLPQDAVRTSVQLDEVLTSLDSQAREDLASTLKSTGAAAKGSRESVDNALDGLGGLGRDGSEALDALAAQSEALAKVTVNATKVLQALDTRQGRIVQLARDSELLTGVLAANSADLKSLMRKLPSFMTTTTEAAGELERLSEPLETVATNLNAGADDLSAALVELPATTNDLRAMLPALDLSLKRAPKTLTGVPEFTSAASPLLPTLEVNLADLNPMLEYLKPYGHDVVSWLTNQAQFLTGGPNDDIGRVKPIFNLNSINLPLPLTPLTMYNPYPAPLSADNPQDFTGTYPRIKEDPIPR